MIKVYTIKNCIACIELKKFLEKQKYEYEEIDLAKDKSAYNYVTGLNIRTVPYIEGNGWSLIGFNEYELKKQLKIERELDIKRLKGLGLM